MMESKLTFNDVAKYYKEYGYDGDVTYEWYRSHICSSITLPDLAFIDKKDFWDTNIDSWFKAEIPKTIAYQKLIEYGVDAVVLPMVGRQIVFCHGFVPSDGSFFVKYYKGEPYVFMLLAEYIKVLTDGSTVEFIL